MTDIQAKPVHAFKLSIDTPGGIPMTLAGKLLETLSEWFPNATIAEQRDAAIALNIPWDDYRQWIEERDRL